MGIHGLMKLLSDECPGAIKEQELSNLTGRKIAIDASMALYQFLIAVRSSDGGQAAMLTNEAGEVTSHIQGMFNRTIKFLCAGVKPVYIFDGKPPDFKSGELAKRLAKREKAEADLAAAKESGETDDIDKYSRRLVKVTKQHNEDCKELLRLMGVPVVNAPGEAEAQCAELAKKGKVFATATEDMDALTFRTPKLLRKLTFSAANKQPIIEIDLEQVLAGLQLTYDQFIDLCILCGCDYCNTIKGIGPKTALKLIRAHRNLEGVTKAIKSDIKKKYQLPKEWTSYKYKLEQEKDETLNKEEDGKCSTATSDVLGDGDGHGHVDILGVEDRDADVVKDVVKDVDMDVLDENEEVISDTDDNDDEFDEDLLDMKRSSNENVDEDEGGGGGAQRDTSEVADDGDGYETVQPLYFRVRELFHSPEVTLAEDIQLKWEKPKEEELRAFLVDRMGFNEERVKSGIKRLMDAQQQKSQQRMDSFFKPTQPSTTIAIKRKAVEPAKGAKGKQATRPTGPFRR